MKLADAQTKLFAEFSQILKDNRLSHAYLFSGDFGSFDMAVWLAQSRFCQNLTDNLPCGICRSCCLISEGEFSDVKIIEPAGQIIKTETIRHLTQEFSQSGFEGQAQFFIIREAEKMHINAANSLLKFIEEPHSQIYIVMLTSDENKILPTIKSRAQLFYFPKNKVYLESLLQREGLLLSQAAAVADLAKDEAQALAIARDSKMLDMVKMAERFTKLLLAKDESLYLEAARLSFAVAEKNEQEAFFSLLTYQLGKEVKIKTARDYLQAVYKAQKMWQANVSFQNAIEYMVLT
ncbi:DNA polymerase III subunit delta' [Streptococcus dentiloxodontae]